MKIVTLRNESKENEERKDQIEMEIEKIRKLKRASVRKHYVRQGPSVRTYLSLRRLAPI